MRHLLALSILLAACGDNYAPEAPDAAPPTCRVVAGSACEAVYPGAGLVQAECDPGVDLRHHRGGHPVGLLPGRRPGVLRDVAVSHHHESRDRRRVTLPDGTERLVETCRCGAERHTDRGAKYVDFRPWVEPAEVGG